MLGKHTDISRSYMTSTSEPIPCALRPVPGAQCPAPGAL